jgi:menaquinone-dependent protoporphyrinogen oxidase
MNKKILIAYTSKYGATAEIAKKIEKDLQVAGYDASAQPAKGIKDLADYSAVILGSALYMGQWQKEAVQFLKANQTALAEHPFWIFTSGPTGEGDPVELVQGRIIPENLKEVVDACNPKDVTVFGGIVNNEKLNLFEKQILKMVKAPSGDFRDWQAISAWTAKIANTLKENA